MRVMPPGVPGGLWRRRGWPRRPPRRGGGGENLQRWHHTVYFIGFRIWDGNEKINCVLTEKSRPFSPLWDIVRFLHAGPFEKGRPGNTRDNREIISTIIDFFFAAIVPDKHRAALIFIPLIPVSEFAFRYVEIKAKFLSLEWILGTDLLHAETIGCKNGGSAKIHR